jgi:hypothetical protein
MLSVPISESALRVRVGQVSIDGVDSITARLEMNDDQRGSETVQRSSFSLSSPQGNNLKVEL